MHVEEGDLVVAAGATSLNKTKPILLITSAPFTFIVMTSNKK